MNMRAALFVLNCLDLVYEELGYLKFEIADSNKADFVHWDEYAATTSHTTYIFSFFCTQESCYTDADRFWMEQKFYFDEVNKGFSHRLVLE